jgi:hypothetical protein
LICRNPPYWDRNETISAELADIIKKVPLGKFTLYNRSNRDYNATVAAALRERILQIALLI